MELIDIEPNSQVSQGSQASSVSQVSEVSQVNSGILEIYGDSNTIKIERNTGHIVFKGNDACIMLGCEPTQLPVDQARTVDMLNGAFEVVQLLIILLIFIVILKVADVFY